MFDTRQGETKALGDHPEVRHMFDEESQESPRVLVLTRTGYGVAPPYATALGPDGVLSLWELCGAVLQ